MPKKREPHFYPLLKRRSAYRLKKNGTTYVYSRYRSEIEADCLYRCFYCDCHEHENGGKANMRLDHFRPHGLSVFSHLKNEPTNLVYACHHCNQRKWHRWPAGVSSVSFVGNEGFIDGFATDRLDFFRVDANGVLHAKKAPAKYLISLLELNRPLLVRTRERRRLREELLPLLLKRAKDLEKSSPADSLLLLQALKTL